MTNNISQEDFALLAAEVLLRRGVARDSLSLDQARYSLVIEAKATKMIAAISFLPAIHTAPLELFSQIS